MDAAIAVDNNMENHNPHISPNPLKCPPPTPLHQMSPDRINQQRIPQSPSLHSYLADHDRPPTRDSFSSDVQSKVAFLNGLAGGSTQSSPTRPRRTAATTSSENISSPTKHDASGSNAAFQRAVMGYEEAQATLASLTADLERAREDLGARKKRERMLAQRLEDLIEEVQAEKEKRVRDQESYTKEIKRCRKETYRAELAVVEARQDLQDTRAELKKSQAEVQHERSEKEKSRQESFERAYALAGTVGELDQVRDRLNVVEKERDAAIAEAKATATEKIALVERTVQTEAMNANTDGVTSEPSPLPKVEEKAEQTESVRAVREAIKSQWSHHAHTKSEVRSDSAASTGSGSRITSERPPRLQAPKVPGFASIISHLSYFGRHVEGEKMTHEDEIKFLKQELAWAKRKHTEDADLIHLMHMQCQFKACPCRLAESNGERFVHDTVYDAKMEQQRASKKRKIAMETEQDISIVQATREATSQQTAPVKDIPKAKRTAPKEPEPAHLPPEPTPELMARASEEPLVLEQAIEVPLPDASPMELDSTDSTPEPTAQLEEFTQVVVEPATRSKPFSFSISTSSNADLRNMAPPLRYTESATAAFETDLFDLSPPKQLPPKRPSTAMGIVSLDSPVRLVPESPRSARSSRDSVRSMARERNHSITKSSLTMTTKIALKDSPSSASLHRRAQSKSNLRSHSPLVTSTVMSLHDDLDMQSTFLKEASASPAASTVFPMTPVHKHFRSMHNVAQHAQMQAQSNHMNLDAHITSPPHTIATTTTTTRVPLRGAAEVDDIFTPEQHSTHHEHARTEVLNVHIPDMTREPTTGNPHSASRTIATSSTVLLPNVPGTPISREAALAQIRARRDRARSVNLKRSLEGSGNIGKENAGGRSPTKASRPMVINGASGLFGGVLGKENAGIRNVREISQASAPGRIAF